MRITQQYHSRILMQQMSATQTKIARLQNQISSGNRLLTAAEDPIAAGKSIVVENALSQLRQYERNSDYVQNRLQSEEAAIAAMNNTMMSIREIALRSNNDTLAPADQAILQLDLQYNKQQMLALVNSKGGNGEYLFSGTERTTAPFDNSFEQPYQGNSDFQLIDTSKNINIAIGTSAEDLLNHPADTRPGTMLTVIDDFQALIKQAANDAKPDDFHQQMAAVIAGIDSAQNHLSAQRSKVGHQLVSLEKGIENNAESLLMLQSEQENLQGLDFPAAISKLESEARSLQAIQATYARMSDLSLFNYI